MNRVKKRFLKKIIGTIGGSHAFIGLLVTTAFLALPLSPAVQPQASELSAETGTVAAESAVAEPVPTEPAAAETTSTEPAATETALPESGGIAEASDDVPEPEAENAVPAEGEQGADAENLILQEQASEKTVEDRGEEEVQAGFVVEEGRIYYYDENGNKLTGQKKIDGFWYMFLTQAMAGSDEEVGAMQTGFVHIPYQNKIVYYSESGEPGEGLGQMQYGQRKIDGFWYKFKQGTGAMETGFVEIPSQSKIVYYSEAGEMGSGLGQMQYGQKKIDGYWYNFKQGTGAMRTGFVTIASQGKIVYYSEAGEAGSGLGQMQYGQKKIGGYWYNFKYGTGAMQVGFVDIPSQSKRVYYNKAGKVGEGLGRMQYGQKKIDGFWYMFRPGSGAMVTGFYRHSDATNKQGPKTCYYNAQGQMQYGKVRIAGGIYIFHESSGALTGPYADSAEIRPNQLVYYDQKDKVWALKKYGRSTIEKAGCGLCSFAMIATALKDEDLTPPVVAQVVNDNQATMYTPMFPLIQAFDNLSAHYGIRRPEIRRYYRGGGVSDISYLRKKLDQGCPMILNGHYGGKIFTSDHFLVLYGQGEKGPLVHDPGWVERCQLDNGGVSWNDALASVDYVMIFSPVPTIRVGA